MVSSIAELIPNAQKIASKNVEIVVIAKLREREMLKEPWTHALGSVKWEMIVTLDVKLANIAMKMAAPLSAQVNALMTAENA